MPLRGALGVNRRKLFPTRSLVEPSEVGFRATTGGPLELSAEAASAAEAVYALNEKIANRLEAEREACELVTADTRL